MTKEKQQEAPGKIRNARRPKLPQRNLMRAAGLNPWEWLVAWDNEQYLYLVDRGMERRECIIIDKATGEVMREKRALGCWRSVRAVKNKLT